MRLRDLLIPCGMLAIGAAVGIVALSSDSHADELPPIAQHAAPPVAPPVPAVLPANAASSEGIPVEAVLTKGERERVDTTGWTKGVIQGDVSIAVSVLDKITTISVCVEEMRRAIDTNGKFQHPRKYIVPVKMGLGTPTFEVRDIDFSEYPYCVSLHAPGLNSSTAVRVIDAKTPLHNDIELKITPGSPFSVLLRDQDQNPYPNIDVRLIPVGDGPGRPPHQKTTDNFGSAVFENVLSGDYEIITGQQGMQLAPPEKVFVGPGDRMYGTKVQGQGHVVIVPRGQPLQISLSCGGYGVADARVKLTASDRSKLTEVELMSDYNGRADFPNLQAGVWMVNIVKDNFEPSTRQITIKEGELPPVLQIALFRKR